MNQHHYHRLSYTGIVTSLLAGLALFALALLWPAGAVSLAAADANTWYVNAATGDDGDDCLSPGTACATIGAAVGKALSGDTIEIASGTYNEHGIEINIDLVLNGAGSQSTIVDAGAAGRAFQIGGTVTIAGLKIQNGQTTAGDIFAEGGGAVLVGGSSQLTLNNSVLVENHAIGSGGAIFNVGALVLQNTQVLSNTAGGLGGGIYNYNLGVITVTQSTLAHNTATGIYGGGIYAGGMGLFVEDTWIADNSAGTFGGGITVIMNNGPTVLNKVTLSGNRAASGAGLFSQAGTITATNSTVSANTASNNYGGIYITGPNTTLFLQNSTIAYNNRTNTAGAGFNGLIAGNDAVATLVNTILAYNQEQNCASSSPPVSLGHNLSSDFNCVLTQTGDLQGLDPQLGPLADNGGFVPTHALLPGSPAIDTGDDSYCPAMDARGIARPFDGDGIPPAVCDIGAFEARNQLIIADSTVLEGDAGTATAVFTVTLSPTGTLPVSVDYTTVAGTAASGVDYTPVADTLTFTPGETEKTISVSVIGDTDDEPDETFEVSLSNASNADLLDGQATGTIIDNDGLPGLSITGQSALEGNAGTVPLQFEVTLSPASTDVVTVDFNTLDTSAAAGSDYTAASGTLTFQPGETSQTIPVNVLGDVVDEGTEESFLVQLSSPANAALTTGQATGTITDDDSAHLEQTFGPQVPEGNSGFTPAVFTVTLSTPAAFSVTVDFAVSSGIGDDGAVAGEDFVSITGTLTFIPGETHQTYTVQVIGDTLEELDERFHTLISNANVPIFVNGSMGLILNDDGLPGSGFPLYLPLIRR